MLAGFLDQSLHQGMHILLQGGHCLAVLLVSAQRVPAQQGTNANHHLQTELWEHMARNTEHLAG